MHELARQRDSLVPKPEKNLQIAGNYLNQKIKSSFRPGEIP
jgi:hypothetical protein